MASRPPVRTACLSRAFGWRSSGASMVPRRPVRRAPREGEIGPLQRPGAPMIGELGGQPAVRTVGFRYHHHAGRILVEPVHDSRPFHPADAREAVPTVRDQCIDQCAGAVSGGRMHHQPLRLVDHDQRIVLVEDVQRDVLALWLRGLIRWHNQANLVPGVDAVAGIKDRAAIDRHRACQNEAFQARARQRLGALRQNAVEPLALFGRGDEQGVDPVGHGCCKR